MKREDDSTTVKLGLTGAQVSLLEDGADAMLRGAPALEPR
jgi:hypothetical protein